MARLLVLLCLQCILLYSEWLVKEDVTFIVVWIGSIISAVLSGLTLGKEIWSGDRSTIKKRSVLRNLSATVGFFLTLQYTSLQGFAISQIACQTLFGAHRQQSRRGKLIYVMPVVALLLQMRIEGLCVLLGCAYSYLALFNEQSMDDNNEAHSSKFYSHAILSVIVIPLANTEVIHNANWLYTKSSVLSMFIVAASYGLYGWKNQRTTRRHDLAICLISTAAVVAAYRDADPVTWAALALVAIGYYLSQRYKTSDESSLALTVDDHQRVSLLLTALSVTAIIAAAFVYIQGVAVLKSTPELGPVQLNLLSLDANYDVPYNASVIPVDPIKDKGRLQCLFAARKMINDRVSKLIVGSEALSLMDLPLHWNLGDSFIWHGDNLFVGTQSLPIVTLRDPEQREMNTLHAYGKNVTLLLHGGGNFGDWWRENADFRLKVLNETSNKVIFLPQSISYREEKYALIDRQAFEKHNQVTLLLRDYPSLKFARERFPNTPSVFVPDMAFMIGPLTPVVADPMFDILFLLRSDTERNINDTHLDEAKHLANEKELSYEVWDFPVDGYPTQKSPQANRNALYDYRKLYPNLTEEDITVDIMPMFRVAMGNKLLSRGSVIVTDRLHASIMGVLIGRPVIYIDNAYKKLSNIWSSMASSVPECTGDNLRIQHADTLDRAVELAYELIRDTRK